MKTLLKQCLSLALILSLTFAPTLSYADGYNDLCINGINDGKPIADSEQIKASCSQAKISRRTAEVAKAQEIMYFFAAGISLAAGITALIADASVIASGLGAWLEWTCTVADLATTAAGIGLELKLGSDNDDDVKAFQKDATTNYMSGAIMSSATKTGGLLTKIMTGSDIHFTKGGAQAAITKATEKATKEATEKATKEATEKATKEATEKGLDKAAADAAGKKAGEAAGKAAGDEAGKEAAKQAGKKVATGCFIAAGFETISAFTALVAKNGAKDGEEQALKAARSILASRSQQHNGFSQPGAQNDALAAKSDKVKGESLPTDDAQECSAASGDNYLKCLGTSSPEISAIVANDKFMNLAKNALGGQSLGDFAKAYQGNSKSDLANYVANGLGLGSTGADYLKKAMDDLNKSKPDGYSPMKYNSASKKSDSPASADLDFGKMMGDMMKQLNPDKGADKSAASDELLFRKLDLLPPDKIEGNKDISLFARIGYRYRKKSSSVDQVNWTREQNQSANASPATPAVNATSSERTPASSAVSK